MIVLNNIFDDTLVHSAVVFLQIIYVRDKNAGTHLLSVVVGLEDVADGPAVAATAQRLQDEAKQPLVFLMRRTLEHRGEGELPQQDGR